MVDKPFRVLLDLTDLQIESFKYVWISVFPRELKTISDFKQSLHNKINFGQKDIKLFVRDGLLLNNETILILRENDTIKVQYEEGQLSKLQLDNDYEKSSKKRKHGEYSKESSFDVKRLKTKSDLINDNIAETCLENISDKRNKKHKKSHNSLSLENETGSNIKNTEGKEKSLVSVEQDSMNCNVHGNSGSFPSSALIGDSVKNYSKKNFEKIITESSDLSKLESSKNLQCNSKFATKNKDNEENESKSKEDDKTGDVVIVKSTNNCPKKKRKRHKKRKKISELAPEDMLNNTKCNTVFKSFTDETLNVTAKRKHTVFHSPPHENNFCEEFPKINSNPNDNIQKLQNISNDTYVLEEVIASMGAQPKNVYPKVSTPTQSKSCVNPSWHISLVQNENVAANLDEPKFIGDKNIKSNTPATEQKDSYQHSKNSKNTKILSYDNFSPLNSMPKIGAHIAFKILELNENYSPEVSEYKEGIVKNINYETDEMEIELMKHEILPGRTGKFENLEEFEVPPPTIKKLEILSYSLLIEPKLLLEY